MHEIYKFFKIINNTNEIIITISLRKKICTYASRSVHQLKHIYPHEETFQWKFENVLKLVKEK